VSKQVVIMRGPSGSGKGSLLRRWYPDARVVSADRYFMKLLGEPPDLSHPVPTIKEGDRWYEYDFRPAEIAVAHAYCMNEFVKNLADGAPCVAVDNTNTHLWEFVNYMEVASLAGYDVRILSLKAMTVAEVILCAHRNAHKTPIEVVARMAYEYEGHPCDEYVRIETGGWSDVRLVEDHDPAEDCRVMAHLLGRVMDDLPSNKDWLDPTLEDASRAASKKMKERYG